MHTQVLVDALTKTIDNIINFIPNLINGLVILVVGYLIARIARWLLITILSRIGLDPLVERSGLTGSLRGLGLRAPVSTLIAQTIFFLLLLSFLITATQLMGLTAVAQLLETLLNFLPSIIAAVILFMLGGIVAQFTGNLVATMASSNGVHYAARLGRIVQYLVILFVVVLVLGTLKIDTALLITAFTLAIAAFALALGLALGLGARSVAHHVLAGYYLRQRYMVGQSVSLNDVHGEVSGISGVSTLIATEEGTVIIPNGILLESVVKAPQRPTAPDAASEPLQTNP